MNELSLRFGGSEHFLLVHFRDEDNRTQRGFNESIKQRLRKSMLDGIKSLDRQFKFIGTSTGQMKELAFWFINLPSDIPDITAAHKLLGKFEGITNIATYVARVGQYFSTTWPIGVSVDCSCISSFFSYSIDSIDQSPTKRRHTS
jgi:hypothetical protein